MKEWAYRVRAMSIHQDTAFLSQILHRLREGDATARDELIRHSCNRLRRLTDKMLRHYPSVRRWWETDDVQQDALLKLHKALATVHPDSTKGFFHFAAHQIRQVLVDLARKLKPHLLDKHESRPMWEKAGNALEEFRYHELVEALPSEERAVVDLLHYHEMTQAEAASELRISERTLKRRWRHARERLGAELATTD